MNPPRGPTKTDLDSMLNALYHHHRHRQPESINIPQPYKLAYNANMLVATTTETEPFDTARRVSRI